ncbi:MAG: cytochrome c oxidase subunit 4 [Candidatus Tumulicola sp.]
MKTGVGLFTSSAIFGVVIATAYWFFSHDYAGVFLLGPMGAGLAFASIYAIAAEREADLDGDDPNLTQPQAAGEDLGTFTTASAWPVLMACAVLVTLLGAIWFPFLLFAGIVAMLLILWRFGAESSRVGREQRLP